MEPSKKIPFDWESDEGLDPDIDSTPYARLDPKRRAAGGKIDQGIAPFLQHIQEDIRHVRLFQIFGWCLGHKYWVSKLDIFILLSLLIASPVIFIHFYIKHGPASALKLVPWYGHILYISIYLEIGLGLWTIGSVLHHFLVRYAHKYITMPIDMTLSEKKGSDNEPNISKWDRICSSAKFQHIVSCSHVLFLTVFVACMLIAFVSIFGDPTPLSLAASDKGSKAPALPWYKELAFFYYKGLWILLTCCIFVSIEKLFVARLVSNFYETAYSTRLADFSYTIKCIKRLYNHATSCNNTSQLPPSLNYHERYCLQSNKKPYSVPEPLKCPSVYHQIQYLLSSAGSDDESTSMINLIDTRAGAKRIAKIIFEHLYTPSVDEKTRIEEQYKQAIQSSRIKQAKTHSRQKSRGNEPAPIIDHTSIPQPVITSGSELYSSSFSGILAPQDIQKLFGTLDANKNGSVSPFEMKVALINLQKQRTQLFKSLSDHGKAVGKLDSICFAGAIVLTCVLIPVILGYPLKGIASFVTLFLSFKFLFENTFNTILQSVIFLFVTHPFDVGDRVFINNETMFVHEMGLFCTTFLRFDSHLIYYPNASLINQHVVNIRRSGPMTEWIDLAVDISTPKEKLDALNARLSEFILSQPRDFETEQSYLSQRTISQRQRLCVTESPSGQKFKYSADISGKNVIEVKGWEILDNRLLRLGIVLRHRFNFQEGFPRAARHYNFMCFLHDVLRDLDIRYYQPTLRIELKNQPIK